MTLRGVSGSLLSYECLTERSASGGDNSGVTPLQRVSQRAIRSVGPASSLRAIAEQCVAPVLDALQLGRFRTLSVREDRLEGLTTDADTAVGVVVVQWGAALRAPSNVARRLAASLDAAWCVILNGTHLRLVGARHLVGERHLEFDLSAVADDGAVAATFESVCSRRALQGDALLSAVAASDRRGEAVRASLRQGVLDATGHVLTAFAGRRQVTDEVFAQALTVVYRLLFHFFAESRELVPTWHSTYRDAYSLERLCHGLDLHAPRGLWATIRALSRLAHQGCRAGALRFTPFNGRLFSPRSAELLERRGLDEEAARLALRALSTAPAANGRGTTRVLYRDLGVDQLGAVYEALLDHSPMREHDRHVLRPGSDVRKRTGSFYTPAPIVRHIVQRTLEPLVRGKTCDEILHLRVVDPAMGSGALLVGACEFLTDACERALVEAGDAHSSDFDARERGRLKRRVAESCLFGVDRNGMAVQLARLSLWLATLSADRPLSFLDHHLRTGNSLVGAWLHHLDRPPRRERTRAATPLFDAALVVERLGSTVTQRHALMDVSDTVAQVRHKERALDALQHADAPLGTWRLLADLWCAPWFQPALPDFGRVYQAVADTLKSRAPRLPATAFTPLLRSTGETARRHGFFHWEIEFPEVFFNAAGERRPDAGFDAVLGNPPWDMLRADTPRGRSPQGSSGAPAIAVDDAAALVRFSRESGVYHAQSRGHANAYQLFVERAVALLRPGGRLGVVVPWGFASDHGSTALRRHVFSSCGVESIDGFDNRRAIFPIHRGMRFMVLVARSGESTQAFGCRLGLTHLEALFDDLAAGPLTITTELLARVSPDDLAVPAFRCATDVAIAEQIAQQFAPLGSREGWNLRFGRELNATDDRSLFSSAGTLPVVEGKHLAPFVVKLDEVTQFADAGGVARRLRHRGRARVAYRDVSSATNATTLIAAVLPAACVTTHTVFCVKTPLGPQARWLLCGLLNSFVVNFLVRLRVGSHITTALVEGLPMPRPDQAGAHGRHIALLARRLARRVGSDDGLDHRAQLHARAARLFGLDRRALEHVLSTFHLVRQYERDRVVDAFTRL